MFLGLDNSFFFFLDLFLGVFSSSFFKEGFKIVTIIHNVASPRISAKCTYVASYLIIPQTVI